MLIGRLETGNGNRQILKFAPDEAIIDELALVIPVTQAVLTSKRSNDSNVKEKTLSSRRVTHWPGLHSFFTFAFIRD